MTSVDFVNMQIPNYKLIKAAICHYEDYYAIRSEKKNLFWTGYLNPPQYDSFKTWYQNRLNDPDRDLFIMYVDNICVGALHIDFYRDYAAIGYSVKEAFEGKGYATSLVREAIDLSFQKKIDCPDLSKVIAWISSENRASVKVVEKNGFRQSTICEKRMRFDNKDMYYQYIYWLE